MPSHNSKPKPKSGPRPRYRKEPAPQAAAKPVAGNPPAPLHRDIHRVGVFIDWRNTYHRGKDLCRNEHDHADAPCVIDPVRMARWLVGNNPQHSDHRQLARLAIFQGMPVGRFDGPGRERSLEDHDRWRRDYPDVHIGTHPLRYENDWCEAYNPPPYLRCRALTEPLVREKGIDVQMAIDIVLHAYRGDIDVAIVVTTDTDFRPVTNEILAMGDRARQSEQPGVSLEVVNWGGQRLEVGRAVWTHHMTPATLAELSNRRSLAGELPVSA